MNGEKRTFIIQGEYHVSKDDSEVICTVLGSCVAVCLWDGMARIGGMNHFLLPSGGAGSDDQRSMRYGVNAMERLINDLLKGGARRDRLQAKLFGGARIGANLKDIGGSNAIFARDFLRTEDITLVAESLGGTSARRITFHPTTGKASQYLVPADPDTAPPPPRRPAAAQAPAITLF
jgi:chemotaxis protein CheD